MILNWFFYKYAETSEKHENVIIQFKNSKRQGTWISALLEPWQTGKITILIAQLMTIRLDSINSHFKSIFLHTYLLDCQ
jgi:hypothetical protein